MTNHTKSSNTTARFVAVCSLWSVIGVAFLENAADIIGAFTNLLTAMS
ncbi:hypothetical protein [Agromyces laixinhei]|nr:hypothetical protein [Agromyces laixinhei]